jgi:integrase
VFTKNRVSFPFLRSNEDIHSKQQAQAIYDRLRQAVREGRVSPEEERRDALLTFDKLADLHIECRVKPRGLKTADSIEWRLKPLRSFFGPNLVRDIKTADVEDFIADLRKPRQVNRQADRVLSPASINRSLQLLRAILNWAVAREYLDRSPFRRGSETLIRLFREDNKRRRRISEDEEQRLLNAAPPILRAMIITALDTRMRRGEMLALRFGDIDWADQTITLRGPTTKSAKRRRSRLQHFGSGLFSSGSASMRQANGSLIAHWCSAWRRRADPPLSNGLGQHRAQGARNQAAIGAREESGRVSRPSVRSGSERSTCTGMTHVTSSLRASTNAEYRSPRFEIAWDTPRS